MKKTNFAIIGCGRIAERHAKHIQNMGNLTAVCDTKKERVDKFTRDFNIPGYTQVDDLLKNIKDTDVVSICTPNGHHAEHTIKSLRAGFHVLCEKPMALTVKECENMIFEAEKAHRRLFIVKQNRYNPPIRALKKVIDEGRLGQIMNLQLNCFWNRNPRYYQESDWKGKKNLDGGTLYTQFSHFIDLLIWLNGDITDFKIYRKNFMHKKEIEFEDTGAAILEFENGALGTINYTVNSHGKNMEGSITVFGEKGTVKVGGQYLNVLEYQNIEDYVIDSPPVMDKANDYGFYQGSMSNHDLVYKNVIDVLTGKGAIATNAIEGMKVVRIIENMYKASEVR
ncbi:MAG: Gfo/Idh/MocA family oxidoreductase [Calditrichaceae bacterium]|nr:Gfo/Idh/MocA family oxidoreductase [Calditrichaceae bacterium]MBN2710257.1 Gfo/Idh/MocA family oxidoreductase [Calditrichaceae bacterium]RQV93880.1 MAG: gfo/Idh/MocA family oxidoreductase [Calditrichota bacterium]